SVAQPVDEQTARRSKPAPAARAYDRELVEAVKRFQAWQGLGAASVPCALDEAVRDGRIKAGQLVLLEAFGGGFTWGSALIRF
ncbi:hypothetical protein ONJ23_27865, partial [Salmonella enterica subsp. enterica serovar Virginia]|nr:hypothetical protein [Salmonella enterica subsp. enterica serovar Virginia]